MDSTRTPNHPSYREILGMAWPVVLASISTPLLGLVDTAIIGQTRPASALGAIAVGSLLLSFVYWAFGFLRMSTTGFVAQAEGAKDGVNMRAASFRAVLLGAALGTLILALHLPIALVAFPLFGAAEEVSSLGQEYFSLRIWAAPATLVTFALSGILIGLGKTRALLALQVLLNGLNIGLDLLLAGVFDLGVYGIALGTLIAEWVACLWGLWLVYRILHERHRDAAPFFPWQRIRQADALRATMIANGNIMVRTLAMLASMAWFTRQGAQLGETVLAANHVLLSIISFCAFFIDGIAFPTEALTGTAKGRRDLAGFDRAVRRTSVIATIVALVLALTFLVFGEPLIRLITDLPMVIDAATAMLPFAAVYVAISVAAFQLDGIFIGTSHTREMRNAALASSVVFIGASAGLISTIGQIGLWVAMLIWITLRALSLAYYYPAIRQDLR